MPASTTLAALRAAILEERLTQSDVREVLTRYDVFLQQVAAFDEGTGHVPSTDEFAAWRKDSCLVRAIHATATHHSAAVNTDKLPGE